MFASACSTPGGLPAVERGVSVEVMFRSPGVVVQEGVAARCGLTAPWRLSATRVRYQFDVSPAQALECLRSSPEVRAVAVPL